MKATTVREMLASDGIRSLKDLYSVMATWPGKVGQSNYDRLVSRYGEANADKVMRLVEVAEWRF